MDAALTCQSAIQRQILIGESLTPAKSCRTRPSKVETRINFNAANTETGPSRLTRSGPLRQELFYSSAHRAAPERRFARLEPNDRPTDEPTYLGTHVFEPGMRFWPQPSQLKMPKYAAASNSGCVSFAALAICGSAVATKELAAACANWRREWSTEAAGVALLCCWWRAVTHKCWRAATQAATRHK